jgi:serine/threonine protein kinase/tetratricopeptide (TPR) repeat protein
MERKESWDRLKDLFDEAVQLEPARRERFVEERCQGDEELRGRLAALLLAHDGAAGFLAAPSGTGDTEAMVSAGGEVPGSLVGPYKLLQRIGEGGFGVVYMAEQQGPIVRKVALKVVKHGMDTEQVVARFEAERQALALMDHPNIAQVFDAGTTGTGRPFFVMELVRGIPITGYCDRQNLSNRARLELFLPVLHAVQHAHQKGVIHRDLKPGNVLVTEHDGRPVPKIIDFGIAKATSMRLTERTLFTEYGQFVGTPEYMSPEQTALSGLDVDTRSDIYSLGVLLYELLTGQKPIEPERLRSLAFLELLRVIREEEPAKPSTRVSRKGEEITQAARHRGLAPTELAHALRGEPDWIVMKALAKDRARRYDTAGAFAADIEHYLRSEPVAAGPPGMAYRAGRFLRRHRIAATVAAVVVVAVLGGSVLAAIGFVRARQAEAVARQEAMRSALDADAMRALISLDGETYLARTLSAIALERRVAARDPRRLAASLASTLYFLGGLAWGDQATAASESVRLELEPEAFQRVFALPAPGDSASLVLLDDMMKYARRLRPDLLVPLLRKSIEWRAARGGDARRLAEDRGQLALALQEQGDRLLAAGRLAEAERLLKESVERWRRIPPGASTAADASLGACELALGRYPEAESLLTRAEAAYDSREHLDRLVELYRRWGKPALARRWAGRMAVDSVRELGPLPVWASMASRDLGYGGVFRGRSIWLFGTTTLAVAGRQLGLDVIPNSWCWSTDRDVRDGVRLVQPADARGLARQFIPFTAEEQARLAADSTLDIGLDPGPLVEDPKHHRGLVVYTKWLGRKHRLGGNAAGSSIAVWSDFDSAVFRPELRPGTAEPTLLFQRGELTPSTGAVVARDTLYLYATRPNFLSNSVFVARVPLARALDREAWRYYCGKGQWTTDAVRAIEVMLASPHLSVHWNAYLRRYLAITNVALDDGIELRTAPRPEGPWSAPQMIARGAAPRWGGLHNWAALAHPELSRGGGRVEYVSYRHPTNDFNHEIRLMEIVLH